MSDQGNSSFPQGQPIKVRIRKLRSEQPPLTPEQKQQRNAELDRTIAEIIPALAEVTVSGQVQQDSLKIAEEIRKQRAAEDEAERKSELQELGDIYNMGVSNPVDFQFPKGPWKQKSRQTPRKVVLSHYQYEMINYQRMLMRKNIWYYRDRMSVPRGPCPLHVLKDCWVQGVIDENTLVWGGGLYDWLPIKNVKLLIPMIRTPEVQLGAWMKKTFALKPALNRIREERKGVRPESNLSDQVSRMR